ncbi:XTP/dITP diphosphatase [Oscillospiraceae bacterium CM]|nr:XTP/dITP diphosphatase [Oscillospiraceae bacterium CM]
MTFVLASNNQGKLSEMTAILSSCGISVISLAQAGIFQDVEETGQTFYENAFLKANAAMKATNQPAIADDSGLVVEALNGAPGVYSKRYGGAKNDDERNKLLLKNMNGVEHRGAKFVSSIVCAFPNGNTIAAEGVCEGEILTAPRGGGGFGYDPVFLVRGLGRSMAELTPDEKNSISHRGQAMRLFSDRLRNYLTKTGEKI